MARLKNNGAEVIRALKGRLDWRVMSNGNILRKRLGECGAFKIVSHVMPAETFAGVRDILLGLDWDVEVRNPAWLPLRPAPTKIVRGRRNPGLLRAMADQKTKPQATCLGG